MPGVNRGATVLVERERFVTLLVGAFHAGRARGHAGHGEAAHLRALLQQPLDVGRGHMTFDGVAVDPGGVARTERRRHAVDLLVRRHVRHILGRDLETVGLQVLDPFLAAAAGRALVDRDLGGERRRADEREQ